RHCWGDGSVCATLSAGPRAHASSTDYFLHVLVATGVDLSGLLVRDSIPERSGDLHCGNQPGHWRSSVLGTCRGICGRGDSDQDLSPTHAKLSLRELVVASVANDLDR